MERIALSQIDDNPYQVRTEYGRLDDLTGSLLELRAALPQTSGLLQVPLARRVDGRVQLALGHRRRRAFMDLARENGEYVTLPVQIADLDDQAMADVAWNENEKRRDVSDVERALAIEIAMRDFGWTQVEIGRRWGISQPTVANLLRLLRLPEKVQGLIRQGVLTGRHGRALLPLVDLGARWETYLDMIQDGAPGQYRSVEAVEREVSGYIGRETYALEAVDWDETWDPQVNGLRACIDCPQRVQVGREYRCISAGCFVAKGKAYHYQVEGPKKAAEVYRAHTRWQAANVSSYARCAGCGRDASRIYTRGQWLKSDWYYICPECARRAGLEASLEEAPAPRPQPVYVRREEPVDVAAAVAAQRVMEDAWAQKSESNAAQVERQVGLAAVNIRPNREPAWVQGEEIHTAPPAQAETWEEYDENVDTVLAQPARASLTKRATLITARIAPGDDLDARRVFITAGDEGLLNPVFVTDGVMADIERMLSAAVAAVRGGAG